MMDIILTDIEARVLGSLIEKDLTTPEYYPLSLTPWFTVQPEIQSRSIHESGRRGRKTGVGALSTKKS